MADPLIPYSLYNDALAASNDPDAVIQFANSKLPLPNLLLLKYVCRALRVICHVDFVEDNKMNATNLSLIFAPTLIYMDTNKPSDAMKNLKLEIQVVFTMILHLFPTPEEEENFAACDEFICARCNINVSPRVKELLYTAGRDASDLSGA